MVFRVLSRKVYVHFNVTWLCTTFNSKSPPSHTHTRTHTHLIKFWKRVKRDLVLDLLSKISVKVPSVNSCRSSRYFSCWIEGEGCEVYGIVPSDPSHCPCPEWMLETGPLRVNIQKAITKVGNMAECWYVKQEKRLLGVSAFCWVCQRILSRSITNNLVFSRKKICEETQMTTYEYWWPCL